MSDAKTYVFGNEGGNSCIPLLASMLNNRGTDPATLMALANNGGFGGNNGWWIMFIMWALWGNNGFGFGRNGEQQGTERILQTLNGDTGREMISQAIQGNATALSQLATTLNCDVNSLSNLINGVDRSVCNVGNQVGLSSQQVISAV